MINKKTLNDNMISIMTDLFTQVDINDMTTLLCEHIEDTVMLSENGEFLSTQDKIQYDIFISCTLVKYLQKADLYLKQISNNNYSK